MLVLAVDETAVAKTFQSQLSSDGELTLDDAAKIVGCWNGLAKRGHAEHSFTTDPAPMRRAVAFSGTIKGSKRIESLFTEIVDEYVGSNDLAATGDVLGCEIQHVDGTYNALERNTRLDWLRAPVPGETCRILTNARCLSEGVDVPALDAVMFLSPRKSIVDIVQSVGRVMRKAPGKQYGYIILPIGIPENLTPEQALKDNKRYAAVWEILQALRAHDERFDAMVNRIDLTSTRDEKINVIGVPGPEGRGSGSGADVQDALALSFASLDEWRDAIYAKIVAKVGSRRYWEDWAKDVAGIAQRHITRITALLDDDKATVATAFDAFLDGLRGNLNDSISRGDAVDMLAQHLITRPIFDALFGGYDFAANNPVAQVMERMLAALDEHSLASENETLEKFYDSVRMRVQGIDTAEGRQEIIRQLYDRFFATAFPASVHKLGIAYTPVEIVDFIIRSADWALRGSFGKGLTDEGVHILDGFTGTGMFMVRLLQSGLITPHDLARKYANELHANEILLLAYYIAAVNIETAYQDVRPDGPQADYEPFPGLILTDTFQSWEDDDQPDLNVFPENNQRLEELKKLDITVILGNPPWSAGQDSANDDNANERYESLDRSIAGTYAERSTATLKNKLYDSYIRAIRWATLRIKERGVIAYVSNGSWLDSNVADGMRQTLAEEFSDIYVLNLRGNQRTAGELSRREGGKIFGAGSRATVAITILLKNPDLAGPARIHYRDIGDFLSREDKLAIVFETASIEHLDGRIIEPNESGDWLDQRSTGFGAMLPLVPSSGEEPAVFKVSSLGVSTNRDAWVYGSSVEAVHDKVARLLSTYETEVVRIRTAPGLPEDNDPSHISWSDRLRAMRDRGDTITLSPDAIRNSVYRPFFRQKLYFDRSLNDRPGRQHRFFPGTASNVEICISSGSPVKPFGVIAVDAIPCLDLMGQTFPRWTYEAAADDGTMFPTSDGETVEGSRQIDNITDEALRRFRAAYGQQITKDDIFYYVYGLLHSPDYRATYAADLKKMLPRIPLVVDPAPYVAAGRELCELHLGYESVEPYALDGLGGGPTDHSDAAYDFFRVDKMRFGKPSPEQKAAGDRYDRSVILYNQHVALRGIPEEAYRYQLGARSAIEWIIDRYQVKIDKASEIRNDPNDWSREVGDPRYSVDLLARIVTVSLRTVEIVDSLPKLDIRRQAE